MKFTRFYHSNQIPEWSIAYIQYAFLATVLHPFEKVAQRIPPQNFIVKLIKNSTLSVDLPESVQTKVLLLEEEFIGLFQEEIRKFDQFFKLQIEILNKQLASIDDCKNLEIRFNLEILYKKAQYLKQCKEINIKAAEKLLKKYSQSTSYLDNSAQYLHEFLQQIPFHNDLSLKKIIKNIKALYKDCGWDLQHLQKHKTQIEQTRNRFYDGLYIGVALFFIICFLYQRVDIAFLEELHEQQIYTTFIIQGLVLLYFALFLCLLNFLKRSYINYHLIFNTRHLQGSFFRICAFLIMIYLVFINLILSEQQEKYAQEKDLIYFNPLGDTLIIDPNLGSYLLWCFMAILLFFPYKYFNVDLRLYFLKLQFKTLLAVEATPEQIWNCEQWVSFTLCFQLVYTNYFNNWGQLIITAIPVTYRLYYAVRAHFQSSSFSHVIKYSGTLAFFVVSYYLRIESYIVHIMMILLSIYCGYVDYCLDWRLKENRRQAFPKYVYWQAGALNIVLVYIWLLTIVVNIKEYENLLFFLAALEFLRRFLWNVLYFEQLHISHLGEFKAVPDVLITEDDPLMVQQREFFAQLELKLEHDKPVRNKANSLGMFIDSERQEISKGLLEG